MKRCPSAYVAATWIEALPLTVDLAPAKGGMTEINMPDAADEVEDRREHASGDR